MHLLLEFLEWYYISILFQKTIAYYYYFTRQTLVLPYLPAERTGRIPSMVEGFNAIIMYILQDESVAFQFHSFLYDYLYNFWFLVIGSNNFSVFRQKIRINNYLESYLSSLLQIIKPHPKIWELIVYCCFSFF